MLMRNMLDRCYFLEKNSGKENDWIIFVAPKSKKDIIEDEERLK